MEVRSKKSRWPLILAACFLVLSLSGTAMIFKGVDPLPFVSTNILLLTLMNLNITLVVIVILLLSRNLIKLFFERREKKARFKTKLIAAFIGLSLIPSILLFVVASGLLTSSIENWFSIQVERSLDASLNVAQEYHDHVRSVIKRITKQIGKDISQPCIDKCPPPFNFRNDLDWLKGKQNEYGVHAIHWVTHEGAFIVSTWPEKEWAEGSRLPFFQTVFPTKEYSNEPFVMVIQEGQKGEIVRAVLAIGERVLAVDHLIPRSLSGEMEIIQQESEGYKQLKAFKNPIKGSYLLSFFIIVLLIVFSAIWSGIYLARGITIPLEKLAEGTQRVAQGDLNFKINLPERDELGMLVASFNKMTHDLKQSREELVRAQKIATWQEVALQMAHEIKNPLTPILLATQRLRKKHEEGDPDFDQIFDASTQVVINEVLSLTTLVNEFSSFARLPPPHCVAQKIEPILREVVLLYQSGHKDITANLQLDEASPLLSIDRDQIKRVLVNLIENAVFAMGGSGTLYIATTYDPNAQQVHITVGDEGPGVAPEDMDKIFLPYFSRRKGGTGLGLAIVHRTILDHGGHIFAEPREPGGTLFTIVLPVSS
ncbi:MAG: ATP-binding protein [Nitrospirota bacterium]